jgi:AraC-like DNA-binding protein
METVTRFRGASAWPVFAGIDFDRAKLFETQDVEQARHLCSKALLPHDIHVLAEGQSFRARMDLVELGPMSVVRLAWHAQVTIDAGTLDNDYLLCLPMKGGADCRHGTDVFNASRSQVGLAGGGRAFRLTASPDYEPIIVRFSRAAVEAAWAALAGEEPHRAICFQSEVPLGGAAWKGAEPVLQLLASHALAATRSPDLPHLHARLQDLILTSLLLNQPHSHLRQSLPAGKAAPARVRRAQEYMLEHIEEPLTVSSVARAVELPTRTLQWAFKSAVGVGPMQWLRQQRLLGFREALLRPQSTPQRIADTAFKFGFGHLGELSQAYRRAFGESPSQTLKRRF